MKKNILFTIISLLFLCFSFSGYFVGNLGIVHAQEDWKQEYAAVCSHTQNAMALPAAELKDYIERCDKLEERLSELEAMEGGTARKVYAKRLKMCRDLYEFTLEYKDKKE